MKGTHILCMGGGLVALCLYSFGEGLTSSDSGNCGLYSLYRICVDMQVPVTISDLDACRVNGNRDRAQSMLDLLKCAESLGLNAVGVRMSIGELLELESPCVAFIPSRDGDIGHFTVVKSVDDVFLELTSYPKPPILMTVDQFSKMWKGDALLVSKPDGWHPLAEMGPRIGFEFLEYDWGLVREGDMVEVEFPFWNVGTAPLEVEDVSSSCSSVYAFASADTVPSGASGTIEVLYDTTGSQGGRSLTISVTSNDPFQPQVNLLLSSFTRRPLIATPTGLDFGTVLTGSRASQSLSITYVGREMIEIDHIEISDLLSVSPLSDLGPSIGSDGVQRWDFKVEFAADKIMEGTFEGEIRISTTDSLQPEIKVPVTAKTLSGFVVRPFGLNFGCLQPGARATGNMVLSLSKNRTADDLARTIRHDEGVDVVIRELPQTDSGTVVELAVAFIASSEKGFIRRNLIIGPVEVPLVAVVR